MCIQMCIHITVNSWNTVNLTSSACMCWCWHLVCFQLVTMKKSSWGVVWERLLSYSEYLALIWGFITYWMDTDDWLYTEQQLLHSHFPLIKNPFIELQMPLLLFGIKKKLGGAEWCNVELLLSHKKKTGKTGFNLDKSRQGPYTYWCCARRLRWLRLWRVSFSLSPYLPISLYGCVH